MGSSPKIPPAPAAPPPPPTPASLIPSQITKSALGGGAKLGGTFLTSSMPSAAPLTKPKKSLLGQ